MTAIRKKVWKRPLIVLGIAVGLLSLSQLISRSFDSDNLEDRSEDSTESVSRRVVEHNSDLGSATSLTKNEPNTPVRDFKIQEKLADLDSMAFGDDYKALLIEIALHYGQFDPESGKVWLLGLENNPINSPAFSVFTHSYALSSGLESLDFFSSIKHPSFRDYYLKGAIPASSLSNGGEVVNFLLLNKDKITDLESHFSRIANAMASSDIDGSFKLLSSETIPEQYKSGMYTGFFGRISTEEDWSQTALTYLEKIPSNDREKYLKTILTEMVSRAPEQSFNEISEVLSKVDSSDARDHAIARFSNSLSEKAPESTPGWINEISDQALRDRVIVQATKKIKNFDQELAAQLLENMNASAEVRKKLTQGFTTTE
jgi:hypothetical protein